MERTREERGVTAAGGAQVQSPKPDPALAVPAKVEAAGPATALSEAAVDGGAYPVIAVLSLLSEGTLTLLDEGSCRYQPGRWPESSDRFEPSPTEGE